VGVALWVARSGGLLVDQGVELGLQRLQKLDGDRARKTKALRIVTRHIGRDRAKEAVAEEEHEGGRAIHNPR